MFLFHIFVFKSHLRNWLIMCFYKWAKTTQMKFKTLSWLNFSSIYHFRHVTWLTQCQSPSNHSYAKNAFKNNLLIEDFYSKCQKICYKIYYAVLKLSDDDPWERLKSGWYFILYVLIFTHILTLFTTFSVYLEFITSICYLILLNLTLVACS